jgi:MoaA/NifB/PqqE/SkfB family radical SAM enzyme
MGRGYDQLFENGFKYITIAGGEPFFRSDVRQLLSYIVKKKPEELVVLTNATLLDDEMLGFLAAHKIILNMTIYYHLPDHHDRISKIKGSWAKTVAGLKEWLKEVSHTTSISPSELITKMTWRKRSIS